MDNTMFLLLVIGILIVGVGVVVMLLFYILKPPQAGVVLSGQSAAGSVISVSYGYKKQDAVRIVINPETLDDGYVEAAQAAEQEAADRERSVASIDFNQLSEYVAGRLAGGQAERMQEMIRTVVMAFKPVIDSTVASARPVSRPQESREAAPVIEAAAGREPELEDRLVAVLSAADYDNVLACYVAERLGLEARVRRVLPDEDESHQRYQLFVEQLGSFSDEELAEYAFSMEPARRADYRRKRLEGAPRQDVAARAQRRRSAAVHEEQGESTLFSVAGA